MPTPDSSERSGWLHRCLPAMLAAALLMGGGCTSPQALKTAAFECGRGSDPKACTLLLSQKNTSAQVRAAMTNNRGVAYARQKPPRTDKALADFTAVIEMDGLQPVDRALAQYNRGLIHHQMKPPRLAEAIADLTAAADAPDLPADLRAGALNTRGLACAGLDPPQWESAIADHNAVLNTPGVRPEHRALAGISRARAYPFARPQQIDEALSDLAAVIAMADVSAALQAEAHLARGDLHAGMSPPRLDQAVADYTAVIQTPAQSWKPARRIDSTRDGFVILQSEGMAPSPHEQRNRAYCRRAEAYARMQPPKLDEAIADYTAAIESGMMPIELRCTVHHERALLHDQAGAIGPAALDHYRSAYGMYLDDLIDFCRRRASTATLARALVHAVHQTSASKAEIAQTLRKLGNICERHGMPVSATILNAVEDKPAGDEWR